jgi:hypothetical protein
MRYYENGIKHKVFDAVELPGVRSRLAQLKKEMPKEQKNNGN